jgi:hypothetical protein
MNLLLLHEIAYKASMVTTKKKYREFERWIKDVVSKYKDAAIEKYARIHLIKLKEQYT